MIELQGSKLVFSFPEVHAGAKATISFQRTLRIPDDDKNYALPPGLGDFPLRHVDDFAAKVPPTWIEHGGVMLPMYQAEAMWSCFSCAYVTAQGQYPFAIKIATGKINAVSGKNWKEGLNRRPQDYVVAPQQPWLDGYCVEKGIIRQFVAMPLGAGYTAEEQLTGKAEHGGLQIMAIPMKRQVFEKRFPKIIVRGRAVCYYDKNMIAEECCQFATADMGLAPGGRMKQEIYDDPFDLADWDIEHSSRCFVHICNSMVWRQITGDNPPTVPPTAKEYTDAGLPWFDYYSDNTTAVNGSKILAGLKSVAAMSKQKKSVPLPENQSVSNERIILLRRGLSAGQVREFK